MEESHEMSHVVKPYVVVTYQHFLQAMSAVNPSVLNTERTTFGDEVDPSSVPSLRSLAGLDNEIAQLESTMVLPLRNPQIFLNLGITPPRGAVLYGPSGCGKTALAYAAAASLKDEGLANFIAVRCTDIVSKYVGMAEQKLAALFRKAREAAPCILFLDQIDALAPVRGHDTSSEQSFDRYLHVLILTFQFYHPLFPMQDTACTDFTVTVLFIVRVI